MWLKLMCHSFTPQAEGLAGDVLDVPDGAAQYLMSDGSAVSVNPPAGFAEFVQVPEMFAAAEPAATGDVSPAEVASVAAATAAEIADEVPAENPKRARKT